MKILVTGASGLVGANIVREAAAAGHEVRALVRPSSDRSSLDGVCAEIVEGDVLDPASLARAMEGAGGAIHCAARFAYAGVSGEELKSLAVDGTRNAIRAAAAANVRRVVVTSSAVVCGSSPSPEVRNEHDALDAGGTAPYVAAKAAQEEAAFEEGAAAGVEVVAACPTLVVGPHDVHLSPSNAVITTFLLDPLRLTYPGGCNLVSAADVARGHLLLLARGVAGERYLLGSENLTWKEVHGAIAELCGVAGPYFESGHSVAYLAAAAAETFGRVTGRPPLTTRTQARMVGRYYWYSHERAAALGYAPRPARVALAEAISWLVASPHVSRELRTNIHLSREVYRARFGEAGT